MYLIDVGYDDFKIRTGHDVISFPHELDPIPVSFIDIQITAT